MPTGIASVAGAASEPVHEPLPAWDYSSLTPLNDTRQRPLVKDNSRLVAHR